MGLPGGAEFELACNDLEEGEYDKLDVVSVLVVSELVVMARVVTPLPAQLGAAVEVEELYGVCFRVDEEVPGAYIPVDDAQAEVEVVDGLVRSVGS